MPSLVAFPCAPSALAALSHPQLGHVWLGLMSHRPQPWQRSCGTPQKEHLFSLSRHGCTHALQANADDPSRAKQGSRSDSNFARVGLTAWRPAFEKGTWAIDLQIQQKRAVVQSQSVLLIPLAPAALKA